MMVELFLKLNTVAKRHLRQDFYIVLASIIAAWAMVRFGAVDALLAYLGDGVLVASFVTGAFFTSVMTTAPAIAVLGVLSLHANPLVVALVGGAGAVCGDYLIFAFVRDRLGDDFAYLLRREGSPRFFKIFHRKSFRWVLPFVGGLIIASPLPDELGLALLGVAKMRTSRFLVISYAFNTAGILLIGLAARSLAS
jgi:hypothetical protein